MTSTLSRKKENKDGEAISYWILYPPLLAITSAVLMRTKSSSITNQIKATKQYFPVVLFIMLYKLVLTIESVDEILNCDHLNESCLTVLDDGALYYAVQGGLSLLK